MGHDRGARVGHRMALDFEARVTRLVSLDVVATQHVFDHVDAAGARAYFHWFLMLQPAPLAETLIGADPEFWLRWLVGRWCATPGAITDEAMAEYVRCFRDPACVRATCEDYRAAEYDLALDEADRGRKLAIPVMVLWGRRQHHAGWPTTRVNVLATWRERAREVSGHRMDCGHFIPEEAPEDMLAAVIPFLEAP